MFVQVTVTAAILTKADYQLRGEWLLRLSRIGRASFPANALLFIVGMAGASAKGPLLGYVKQGSTPKRLRVVSTHGAKPTNYN
jgi:hypothetical protein